jgi:hypothetical protein
VDDCVHGALVLDARFEHGLARMEDERFGLLLQVRFALGGGLSCQIVGLRNTVHLQHTVHEGRHFGPRSLPFWSHIDRGFEH